MILLEKCSAQQKNLLKLIHKIMMLSISQGDTEQYGTFLRMKNFIKSQEKFMRKEESLQLYAMVQLLFVT